jgi:hypothetical protein
VGVLYDSLVSTAMKRYGVPDWLRPYIYRYARESNIDTIKHAISFINVRRKKGEVTGRHVKLPNGVVFDIKAVIHILDQFYYGVETTARIAGRWSGEATDYDHASFAKHFKRVAQERGKHARALKNMIEGLGHKVGKPTKEIEAVFDGIAKLEEWPDRLIATEVIIRDAYSRPFGFIFYKVFYPVSPEFMRSLGKLFMSQESEDRWAEDEIRRVVGIGALTSEHVISLAESILGSIYRSIETEMRIAKKAGIEPEAKLLRDVSIAYPLHTLQELGVQLDVDKEMKKATRIKKSK